MAAVPALLPDVRLSFGPMLIGVFINMMLYGVLLGQMLTYYKLYQKDAAWMRYFVLFLFIIETANTAFGMAFMFQPLIPEYGHKPNLFPTVFFTQPLCVVLVSTPIQLLFAWRIRSLTKSYYVPATIAVLALTSFAGGVWTAAMIRIVKSFANKPRLHNSALLWFLSSCVADILITISLVISLTWRKTGFSGTDSVIDKIIRMTIQTGMLTSVFSILDVVCFMVLPKAAINFAFDLALSKLYTNCLMSTLNARQSLNISTSRVSEPRRNTSHGLVPMSPPARRQHPETFEQRQTDIGALYDLNAQKGPYDVGPYGRASSGEDFGIRVTTSIERIEDPVPYLYAQ